MGCTGSKTVEARIPASATIEAPVTEKTVEVKEAKLNSDTFICTLERKAQTEALGATLTFPEDKTLMVSKLRSEGLFSAWNASNLHKTELQVKEGDRILDVNGVTGDADQMLKALKVVGSIAFTMKRKSEETQEPAETHESNEEGQQASSLSQQAKTQQSADAATKDDHYFKPLLITDIAKNVDENPGQPSAPVITPVTQEACTIVGGGGHCQRVDGDIMAKSREDTTASMDIVVLPTLEEEMTADDARTCKCF